MTTSEGDARLTAAKARFAAFFTELRQAFAEREDVIAQLALALLAREHVLLAGPPGTAKSALAGAVLGRILDEETGRPSLYARQLTESTVQTDVIGPIDFKTLMETGRTEHFTDEGLLGAVHAFLDEVFDGRDMLLRSTLNLLHERELKQGTQITRGRFEVALMTTNRYVAEVLESARETLLAFVDRIAFVGFVPRGFADPAQLSSVLRFEIGGAGRAPLEATLSVQDLDALQAAADAVHIPEPICDGLAKLIELLDVELSAAERADPSFLPTRYLSTRTAVRSGKILRAICMYDAIFRRPDRAMSVEPEDLRLLRLHLLLSGPSPENVATLLGRERDPREKRQLAILRTEREAFDRAFAKLPAIRILPKDLPPKVQARAVEGVARGGGGARGASGASGAGSARDGAGATGVVSPFEVVAPSSGGAVSGVTDDAASRPWAEEVARALVREEPAGIARALREVLPHAREGAESAALADVLFRKGVAALERRALRTTLGVRASEHSRGTALAREVASLADALDQGPANVQALARWVRARALVLVSADAASALDLGQGSVAAWVAERDATALLREAETRLAAVERLAELRAKLIAAGVEAVLRHEADAAWAASLTIVSEELTALCDAALRTAATSTIAAGGARGLSQLLGDVGAVLELLRELDRRARALGLPSSLRDAVVGPRVAPLLEHTFGRVDARDRDAYLGEVDGVLRVLDSAGLADVIRATEWLTWAARALLRGEAASAEMVEGAEAATAEEVVGLEQVTLDHEGYRKLRAVGPRAPNGFILAEVALRTAPPGAAASGLPVAAELLAGLPAELRREIAAADRRRIERVLGFLEQLWAAADDGAEAATPEAAAEQIRRIVRSRFFAILLDDGAASRTLLEIDLLRDLFPEEADAAAALRARTEELTLRARRRVLALVRTRGEGAWSAAIVAAEASGSSAT